MSRRIRITRVIAMLAGAGMIAAQIGCGRSDGGSDDNGNSGGTPTISTLPTVTPTLVVVSGGNIGDIAKDFPDGVRLSVTAGSYPPIRFSRGDFRGSVSLIADTSQGPVAIIGNGQTAAVDLEGIDRFEMDGFELIGGEQAVVRAVDSVDVLLLNNTVRFGDGDGVRLETSAGVLIFDNLIIQNAGAGIAALGQNTVEIINNTIYSNNGGGVVVRRFNGVPSAFVFLQNNIIDGNNGFGISVDQFSTTGFESRSNLNNDGYQGVSAGSRDLTADPLFISPPQRNFRMQVSTGAGNSPAFDRGDPATDPFFLSILQTRTTRPDSFLDNPPADLGYHYPNGIFSPTPIPTQTPTGVIPTVPRPTNTRPSGVPTNTPPLPGSTATPTPTFTPTTAGGTPVATNTPVDTATPTASSTPIQFTPTRTRPVGG
ncbi:MAG TPA: right-handed parallel beta-helix repeat-containing protein [Terriglobales bacterium]|nr:right-handed parallel beta-helix repeat-containing protein [Terriglobales bacterium]